MSALSMEDRSRVVWLAATQGRAAARNGYRATAYAIMEHLDAVSQHSSCSSLAKVARNAAVDIDNLLNTQLRAG